MSNSSMVELIYNELKSDLNALQTQVNRSLRVERAEIADSIPAYTLANAPLNADGGLGDGISYITLAWISDGRRPGEGAGLGTGVLCFHQASSNTWIRLDTYTAVTT
jgi:hypothetical protein